MGDFDSGEPNISSDSSSVIPMSDPTPVSTANTPQEFSFKWNDREIKAPQDKMLQWASQGYDYGQRVNQLKAEQDKFNSERQTWEQGTTRYREVDEFAKTNPEWWAHVEKSWADREQRLDPNADPIAAELSELKNHLKELKEFKENYTSEQKQKAQQENDKQLNDEISGIQKSYPQLDWTGVDDSGLTLEMRVLNHAQQNGISNFRAAFRDYNHDRLMQLTQSQQRESEVREGQQAKKSGFLGVSPTPKKGLSQAQNVKGKSYGDLLKEAKAELGI